MEKIIPISEVKKINDLDFKVIPSKTFKVLTPCGNVYISADFKEDGSLHKIRMQRTSKLHCSVSILQSLFRSITFQSRRDITQAIKDHKATEIDACEKFNIIHKSLMRGGGLVSYNCGDAIARCLEILKKENGAIPTKTI